MKKNKLKFVKIVLLGCFLASCFCFFPNKKVKAAWAVQDMHQAIGNAYEVLTDGMIGMLKKKAVSIVQDRVMALLTGRTNRSLIITDYEDYIFGSAQRGAAQFANSFFRSMEGAVTSSTRRIQKIAEDSIENEILGVEKAIEENLSSIDKMMQGGIEDVLSSSSGGGEAALMTVMNGGNPLELNYNIKKMVGSAMEKSQEAAKIRAGAGAGFDSPTGENNLINMPGKILAEMTATAESLPMMLVAYAESIPEAVASMAVDITSKTIDMGIAEVTEPIDNKLANMNKTVKGGISDIKKKIYNGVKFSE